MTVSIAYLVFVRVCARVCFFVIASLTLSFLLPLNQVNVRTRDNVVHGTTSIDDLITEMNKACAEYVLN